jgi:hypothetical protein
MQAELARLILRKYHSDSIYSIQNIKGQYNKLLDETNNSSSVLSINQSIRA